MGYSSYSHKELDMMEATEHAHMQGERVTGTSTVQDVQLIKPDAGEFPGGSVVRTLCFHCRRPGFNPDWRTKIPQALQCGQK